MNIRNLTSFILAGLLALASCAAFAQSAGQAELGAVMDTRYAHPNGPEVLAITPGGSAEALGLRAGDRLLSVNGVSLRDEGNLDARLEHALTALGGKVQVQVLRDDAQLSLSGSLQPGPRDTVAGCGYVSSDDPTPTVTEGIYPVEITSIDGRSTPLTKQNRHKLTAGVHVLVLNEWIPVSQFTNNQLRQRRLMKNLSLARAYKAVAVTVEPNVRYSLGARLIRDAMDNDSIRANAYWEPVVFKQRKETCH